jgi:hypothetical protein
MARPPVYSQARYSGQRLWGSSDLSIARVRGNVFGKAKAKGVAP